MNSDAATTVEQRRASGKSKRKSVPRSAHAGWPGDTGQRDPVRLIEEQNQDRLAWLVPVRRFRMSASPFAFFRGSARVMAADLANTPVTGINAQLCGDAHIGNFGLYASPERQLVFDINDFDETLSGPWEWDIKRLAASFMIAARHNDLKEQDAERVTRFVAKAYRKAMSGFAEMRTTEIWYAMLDEHEFVEAADEAGRQKQARQITGKAKKKDSRQALDKLAEEHDNDYRIRSDPPWLVPLRDLLARHRKTGEQLQSLCEHEYEVYRHTVSDDCKHLLSNFHPKDVALKVVGVGSVGTRCLIMLLQGRDRHDPLFLQLKEAGSSVLAEYLEEGPYPNEGQRVVEGQRLLQTVSDVFLGWTRGSKTGKHYYWRQLRDWKGSVDVEDLCTGDLEYLAKLCGWTLARAHARSGDPVAIAGYLGSSDVFDAAMAGFATAYADQNELDYQRFVEEIRSGHLAAHEN